jgi:drug/metabolite transporter (DMT)-like permease
MALWASCFPLLVIGIELAPHLAFAALRAGVSGAILLAAALVLRRAMPRGLREWGQIALLGFAGSSLGFLGMFHGAEFLSPGLATLIFNTQPLAAALLARWVLGERLGRGGTLGLALGFAGVILVAWPGLSAQDAPFFLAGLGYLALAALGTAAGNVVMKGASPRLDAAVFLGLSLLIGALPLALASALTEDLSFAWTAKFVVVLLALAIFGTALAFWLWFEALKQTALSTANAFTFLTPVFAIALGVQFFGERVGPFEIGGGALILVGGLQGAAVFAPRLEHQAMIVIGRRDRSRCDLLKVLR